MSRMELNHWFTKDDGLSISLMRFYVGIQVLKNNTNIFYQLTVIQDSKEELTFNFYSLEDAVSFTENVINKCENKQQILDKYIEMFENNQFKSPFKEKKEKDENSTITLTPDEVDEAIIEYFGSGKNYRVSAKEELSFHNNHLDIYFYLIEHLDYDGIKKDIKTMLTRGDLKNALSAYIDFYNYELIDFKYIGGIHRVGYYFDEDTPHYDGIQLEVKTKSKVLSKKRENKKG